MEWSVVAGWPYKPPVVVQRPLPKAAPLPVLKGWRDYALPGRDLFSAEGKVVPMGTMTGSHVTTGKPLDAAYVHVWETSDGKIVRLRQIVDTPLVLAARS